MKKNFSKMTTDEEVETLLDEDLSDYLHSENFKLVSFEFKPKDKTISLRVSEEMLEAVKSISRKEGISYQKYIRRAIEKSLGE